MDALETRPGFERHSDSGCAYITGVNGARLYCGAARRIGSSYCPEHHALCHVPYGTPAENKRLREVEALANAVGGRRGRDGAGPTRKFLKRLEHVVRVSS
jgi:hypothetical protein